MKLFSAAIAVCTGFFLYLLLQIFYGSAGVLAEKQLRTYKNELQNNLQELENFNQVLQKRIDLLLSDKEIMQLQSRQMGYFKPGESIIKIQGYKETIPEYQVGNMIKKRIDPPSQNDFFLKIIAWITALCIFCFLQFYSVNKK